MYIYSLKIERNTYGGKIKPSEFIERLGKAKQLLEWQYNKPEEQVSTRTQQGHSKKVRRRRWSGLTEVSKPSSDTNFPSETGRSNETG